MMKKRKQTNEEGTKETESPSNLRIFVNGIRTNKVWKTLLVLFVLLYINIGSKYPARSESISTPRTVIIEKSADVSNYPVIVRKRVHDELVSEVKKYITGMSPKSKVSAEILVDLCLKYEMDIPFVLSQGLIESNFGTEGTAAKSHSVFNVGTWDSKHVLKRYKTPNESIEPFLILLKTDYLSKRSMKQLLYDGGYKNKDGNRYAKNTSYELILRSTITNINLETSIKMYQGVINLSDEKILAYFGPDVNGDVNNQLVASLK